MNITVGSDPEVFFTDKDKPTIYPASMVFNKHFGGELIENQYGALIVDGAALEFQPFPSLIPEEVVANLRGLLEQGVEMANIAGKVLAIVPEMAFDLSWCKRDHRLGEFGCAPDKSAWGEGCRPATIDATKHRWRYAGCHIHAGVIEDQDYFLRGGLIECVSQALDRTVGLASMVLSGNQDKLRRNVYGRPGIYRHQPWGMEYRTPSNGILRSPQVMEFIFRLTQITIELSAEHHRTMKAVIPDDVIVQTLRGDDLGLARELYMRMANVFCLDKIPQLGLHWEDSWFGTKSTSERPSGEWITQETVQEVRLTPRRTGPSQPRQIDTAIGF